MDEVTRQVFAGWLADQIIACTPRGQMDDLYVAEMSGARDSYRATARYVGVGDLVDRALEDRGHKRSGGAT
jgi:hypothetical protein